MTRTRKRPYTKSKRFDKTCRNHGGCPWCLGNRTHADQRNFRAIADQLIEYYRPALEALAHGPKSTAWPCPHAHREVDPRNGRAYCLDCYHWLESET